MILMQKPHSEILETIKKLRNLPFGEWFSVKNKAGEDLTNQIKELIDGGEQFELSNDYKRFKRLFDPFI